MLVGVADPISAWSKRPWPSPFQPTLIESHLELSTWGWWRSSCLTYRTGQGHLEKQTQPPWGAFMSEKCLLIGATVPTWTCFIWLYAYDEIIPPSNNV